MPRIRTFRPRALDGSLMSNPVEYWPLKVIALDRADLQEIVDQHDRRPAPGPARSPDRRENC